MVAGARVLLLIKSTHTSSRHTPTDGPADPPPETRSTRGSLARWALVVFATLLAVALIAGIGPDHGPIVGLSAVTGVLLGAGGPVLLYAIACAGWGVIAVAALLPRRNQGDESPEERAWLAMALGLATMLTISHALGWAGAMTGGRGARLVTLLPLVIGVASLVVWSVRTIRSRGRVGVTLPVSSDSPGLALPRLRVSTITSTVGVAVLLVASCSTPGLHWESEFHGFDAFAYHLQLAKEWLAAGRLKPLEHNVYSYLPSYIEAAYMHIGALGPPGGGQAGGTAGRADMLGGDGDALVSCQLLHAAITILAAGLLGRCCDATARMAGLGPAARGAARMTGWAVTLTTPWTIVVGSLAYNEMGMIALGAGAMLVALHGSIPASRRAVLAGLLVGVACACKPTALFMVGPVVGLILLARTPARQWWRVAGAGSIAGMAMLAPWMVRNWASGGNPVFPHMNGLFGAAHWTTEQVARYAAAHHAQGSLGWRLALLIWPDAGDPAAPGVVAQRGLLHPQFFAFLPIACVAGAGVVFSRWRRRLAWPATLLVLGGFSQVLAWALFTHAQSRFLIPVLLTGVPLIGLAMAMAVSEHELQTMGAKVPGPEDVPGRRRRRSIRLRRRLLHAVLNSGLIVQAVWVVMLFGQEGRGEPNQFMIAPGSPPAMLTPAVFTGTAFRAELAGAAGSARVQVEADLFPEAYVNLVVRPGPGALYMLGDSTPLYFSSRVLYHSTFDRSPLGDLMRERPTEPEAWARGLWERGVRHVMLNTWELERLHDRCGWYDPDVSPARARTFLDGFAEVVRAWPEAGKTLYRLREPGASAIPSRPEGGP